MIAADEDDDCCMERHLGTSAKLRQQDLHGVSSTEAAVRHLASRHRGRSPLVPVTATDRLSYNGVSCPLASTRLGSRH